MGVVSRYESTGNVVGYKPAPDLLIGRLPVYEMEYVVKELCLKWKDNLFTFLMGTYGERVFDSKEEAEEKCKELNDAELKKSSIC